MLMSTSRSQSGQMDIYSDAVKVPAQLHRKDETGVGTSHMTLAIEIHCS